MDQKIWILIYSKFSNASKNIYKLIESVTLPFRLTPFCIDNIKNRKAIQQSDTFKIDKVPCIICIDRVSGVADQYDGEKAFELIEHFYNIPKIDINKTTNISDELIDDKIEHDGEYRIKQKLSVSEILNQADRSSPQPPQKRIEQKIEQKKSGSPVNVAAILARITPRDE